VSARQRIARKEPALAQGPLPEQGLTTLAEQYTVMQFVDRVLEVETAQQGIGSDFGRAQDVATAIGFDVSEDQQLPDTSIVIAPHPLVQRAKQSIQRRRSGASGHRQWLHLTQELHLT
jgi:hypothetical protein